MREFINRIIANFKHTITNRELKKLVKVGADVHLGNAKFGGRNIVERFSCLEGNVNIGYATTLGEGCILRGDITVGRYCQLAPRVSIFAKTHPYNHATNYVNRALLGGLMKGFQSHEPISVGSDVWMGYGAVVLKGVKVGDGAVVGAASVVTKDVPDYAIVVGAPATTVRMRFDEKVVSLMKELSWWDMTMEELDSYEELFATDLTKDVAKAVDVLEEVIERKQKEKV